MSTQTLVIPSTYLDVRTADEALRSLLSAAQIPEAVIGSCELALHELLINLVDHAYSGDATQSIRIILSLEVGALVIQTVDTGEPVRINLETISLPDPTELAEGGYGMGLIRSLVDQVEYQTKDGQNIWTLRKKVS